MAEMKQFLYRIKPTRLAMLTDGQTEDEAQQIMGQDPAVVHGVMSAKLFPYRIGLISEAIKGG